MINLFQTRAFWGIIFTLFLAIEPKLEELQDRAFVLKDWLNIAATLASASLVLMEFHAENSNSYTPKWLPGRNRKNEDQNQQ